LIKNRDLKRLKKSSFTIISNNCIGGIIYYDYGLQFKSPTVNLFFYAPDYIRFLENLPYYLNQQLTFSLHSKFSSNSFNYPIGKLADIEIHFMHFETFDEANKHWVKRLARVDLDNLFVVGSDRDQCTDEIRKRFADLPFSNKVFFTSRPSRYKHEIYFDEYKAQECIGDLIAEDKAWNFYFDVPKWINTGIVEATVLRKQLFKAFRKMKKRKGKTTSDIF
jgi:uncharacterized protein (DUF1919 family)